LLARLIQDFRDKIGKGAVVGPFSKSSDPAFVEVIGHAGFDFVVLDLEYGPNNVLRLQNLIRAAEVSGLLPIVRVKENAEEEHEARAKAALYLASDDAEFMTGSVHVLDGGLTAQ
jgi:4-hydroxy-2-oxoheptanedioate aldolase